MEDPPSTFYIRDFDEHLFIKHPNEHPWKENDRLDGRMGCISDKEENIMKKEAKV